MTELSDITLRYAGDGSSKRTDALGMRAMQARVWAVRDARYILVKSPPASGKSRAAMFVGLDKLMQQAGATPKAVAAAVPESQSAAALGSNAPALASDPRNRDLMRGRERGER